ncbi:MAG: UDP-N-acetylglucosamine 2-epimerase [Herbinix sp.]|jgi:UDP-N-acetylglucosamine 2-epimerase (non-hydrolysing)|nr:UDP-N-acetylglucosamine 2-epimerase [Herbinix sp.]
MKKLKVMTVVGTRPEIIRLSSVIKKLNESDAIDHVLVHTGQNYDYELNQVFFEDLQLSAPDYYLDAAKGNATETIGNILINIEPILFRENPNALLVLGDTNSCLSAIAAKKRQIPIFHMEAGNRCFDQRVPEETNRKLVDHIADINLPYSEIAKSYLIKEGFPQDRIIKTGSPMFEVIQSKLLEIENSDILDRLELKPQKYYLVSFHREENVNSDHNLLNLVDALNEVAIRDQLPIIISTHPRTRNRLQEKKVVFHPLIKVLKPFGYLDYLKLQSKAKAVLSDSGTISEEAAILKFKAVNLRQAHERMEAMEEAIVMLTGLSKERILQALEVLETQTINTLDYVEDYTKYNVSEKVLRIIISYTDYINRVVWNKDI